MLEVALIAKRKVVQFAGRRFDRRGALLVRRIAGLYAVQISEVGLEVENPLNRHNVQRFLALAQETDAVLEFGLLQFARFQQFARHQPVLLDLFGIHQLVVFPAHQRLSLVELQPDLKLPGDRLHPNALQYGVRLLGFERVVFGGEREKIASVRR